MNDEDPPAADSDVLGGCPPPPPPPAQTQPQTKRKYNKKPVDDSLRIQCTVCSYSTTQQGRMRRHVKKHQNSAVEYKCEHCDKTFKEILHLNSHRNLHLGSKPFKCDKCEFMFGTKGELTRHIKYKHTLEKPHKCTTCEYSTVELSKLRRHMRVHTDERPYLCGFCDYAGRDTFRLKRHLRVHTGEKPYKCPHCESQFAQSNSLKAHLKICNAEAVASAESATCAHFSQHDDSSSATTTTTAPLSQREGSNEVIGETEITAPNQRKRPRRKRTTRLNSSSQRKKSVEFTESTTTNSSGSEESNATCERKKIRLKKEEQKQSPKAASKKRKVAASPWSPGSKENKQRLSVFIFDSSNKPKPVTSESEEATSKGEGKDESGNGAWFTCSECFMRFLTDELLHEHYVKHTGDRPFECEICHIKFSHKFALRAHLQCHDPEHLEKLKQTLKRACSMSKQATSKSPTSEQQQKQANEESRSNSSLEMAKQSTDNESFLNSCLGLNAVTCQELSFENSNNNNNNNNYYYHPSQVLIVQNYNTPQNCLRLPTVAEQPASPILFYNLNNNCIENHQPLPLPASGFDMCT